MVDDKELIPLLKAWLSVKHGGKNLRQQPFEKLEQQRTPKEFIDHFKNKTRHWVIEHFQTVVGKIHDLKSLKEARSTIDKTRVSYVSALEYGMKLIRDFATQKPVDSNDAWRFYQYMFNLKLWKDPKKAIEGNFDIIGDCFVEFKHNNPKLARPPGSVTFPLKENDIHYIQKKYSFFKQHNVHNWERMLEKIEKACNSHTIRWKRRVAASADVWAGEKLKREISNLANQPCMGLVTDDGPSHECPFLAHNKRCSMCGRGPLSETRRRMTSADRPIDPG